MKNKEKVTYACNINILTTITDWKIPWVYIHVYQIIKNRGPGPYKSLRHADKRKYFSGLSLTRNWREVYMFYLAREVGKILRCSFWEKGNYIMVNEFKYGQTWKIWPSSLSLSLYSTFKDPRPNSRYKFSLVDSLLVLVRASRAILVPKLHALWEVDCIAIRWRFAWDLSTTSKKSFI